MSIIFKQKNFAPFFWTQFWGAFNDNLFKNALVIFLTYRALTEAESGVVSSLSGGLFILPFILFSTLAGQMADRYEKSSFIRFTKIAEIFIMSIAALGFWFESQTFLLLVLFLMGTQSTFFGPVKYSLLPQIYPNDEDLMSANSLIEMGTFLAILTGTLAGGFLANYHAAYVCIGVFFFALLGWRSSCGIPKVPLVNSGKKIELNPIKQVKTMLNVSLQNHSIIGSIFAISWFWFLGGVILSQIPVCVKYMINADKLFVTVVLTTFTLSLALGSFICNKLSNKKIELALVFIGSIGLSLFTFDLSVISYPIFSETISTPYKIVELGKVTLFTRLLLDFFLVGFFGSLYIVPLYALLQKRSKRETCSEVIAANNILNSIFILLSAAFIVISYDFGLNIKNIFFILGILNFFSLIVLIIIMPEVLYRFLVWLKKHTHSEFIFQSKRKICPKNPTLVVGECVTKDPMVLSYFLHMPIRLLITPGSTNLSLVQKFLNHIVRSRKNDAQDLLQLLEKTFRKGELLYVSKDDFTRLIKNNKSVQEELKKSSISVQRFRQKSNQKTSTTRLKIKRQKSLVKCSMFPINWQTSY
ncbi:MAG: hypothetical protein CMP11_07855 [Zetaproteobacteria bacterium]|nr:hypothetical protein [Pseudobdellovibrionaceae bacterium]|tara:strand:- start:412 stop:2169 length:1758 start_codon:yes stop_codon:yes gene_type:complete